MNTQILNENEKRKSTIMEHYDPQAGIGCTGDRVDAGGIHLPCSLLEACPEYDHLTTIEKDRQRIRHDFEYWCWRCVKIVDKLSGRLTPFVLNRPQRRLLAAMEGQRLAGEPVRIILLKARQWGGSTLVQVYIAWLQLVVDKGRNSIIVGHKRNSSFAIKQMLRTLLANYPQELLDDDAELALKNVPDCKDIQEIAARDCSICLTSSYSPDAARGLNLSFAHLSEVAFWNSNRNIDPNDLIRTVTGSIPLALGTVIVMESTANGTNSFFYNEWKRAVEGKSAFKPVFVAWSEIEIYRKALDGDFDLDGCDEYEKSLWEQGLTLEQIYWYHEKRKEFSEHNLLKAEFPSTAQEAFENSMDYVFSTMEQEAIQDNIAAPRAVCDDGFVVWHEAEPCKAAGEKQYAGYLGLKYPWPDLPVNGYRSRYLAVITIGSESDERQPSVISIWEVNNRRDNMQPRLAASWTGNLPLNILAVLSVKWATRYGNALMVIENNDLQARQDNRQQGTFVLNEVFLKYKNLYINDRKNNTLEVDKKVFSLMFYELILSARNGLYIDHDERAARTVAKMIVMPNGYYYADKSENQNLLFNRAEALYVMREIELKNSRL